MLRHAFALVVSVTLLAAVMWSWSHETSTAGSTTKPSKEANVNTEKATFAAGCFWGVEETFRKVPGVLSTRVGYTGGTTKNPTYRDVCTDATGHAEAIEVVFDPQKVSYQALLEVFFENHDPTTMNRQGPDFGTQYRSAIFYHSPEQQRLAQAEKDRRNRSGEYVGPIVTQIVAAGTFYSAEEYHQRYYQKKGVSWSCTFGNGKKQKVEAR
jgi:peptide-methionine (S)-S-oxide reductase